jgi:hypothetical protein
LRHLVSKTFTPRRIAGLEANIQTMADDLLDQPPRHRHLALRFRFRRTAPGHRHRRHARRPSRRSRYRRGPTHSVRTSRCPCPAPAAKRRGRSPTGR